MVLGSNNYFQDENTTASTLLSNNNNNNSNQFLLKNLQSLKHFQNIQQSKNSIFDTPKTILGQAQRPNATTEIEQLKQLMMMNMSPREESQGSGSEQWDKIISPVQSDVYSDKVVAPKQKLEFNS